MRGFGGITNVLKTGTRQHDSETGSAAILLSRAPESKSAPVLLNDVAGDPESQASPSASFGGKEWAHDMALS